MATGARSGGLRAIDGKRLSVLQVSTRAQAGGAERVALSIHEGLQRRGHHATLVVGERNLDGRGIVGLPRFGRRARAVPTRLRMGRALTPFVGKVKGARLMRDSLVRPGAVRRRIDLSRGRESFEYPGSRRLLDLTLGRPDVVHCHNLHGGYFDLRYLKELSAAVPLALTLHDEWTYTGHCGGTLGCERWRIGCGSCPDLTIYPALMKDGTAANLRAKAEIYRDSRFHVSVPSDWLLARAMDSILAEGAVSWRVIRNGVDLAVFRPGDQAEARRSLDLPLDAHVLLFSAFFGRQNRFKDHSTAIRAAGAVAAEVRPRRTILVMLGDDGASETDGDLEVRTLPFEPDPERVATLYRAADVLLHAAFAEVAGLVVIEAMASGLPVIATAVGGLPESVRSMQGAPGAWDGAGFPESEATGVLVPPGDADGMARAARWLLADLELRLMLGQQAQREAERRFDMSRMLDAVEQWYRDMIG
jgi:glycosyltransferase involved in cell wall biosynthesis